MVLHLWYNILVLLEAVTLSQIYFKSQYQGFGTLDIKLQSNHLRVITEHRHWDSEF